MEDKKNNFKPLFKSDGSLINTEEAKIYLIEKMHNSGYDFDIENPKTIQEKLLWLMIYDCNSLKTKCADKYLVRQYIKEKIEEDICPKLYGVYNSIDEIGFSDLPSKFIIKCNHLSRANIRIEDKSNISARDYIEINSKFLTWLLTDLTLKYSLESQYYNIERKIIVEELLSDKYQTDSLFDYKFWCFNGEPKLYTINDGNGHGDIVYYDMNDDIKNFYGKDLTKINYKKPDKFNEMIEIAKKLSSDFKFVRVDLYEVNGKVYFGELTFTPGAGCFKYKKRDDELFVGSLLEL